MGRRARRLGRASQSAGENSEPWQLCYPRDLESKGMYTGLWIPNDAGERMMRREEPSHGMFVGFPTYTVKDTAGDAHHLEVTIPEGERFGFWPGSDSTYIVSG